MRVSLEGPDPAVSAGIAADRPVAASTSYMLLMALTAVMALLGFVVLALRWHQPLLGMHSFRQTQTAVTAYSIYHGGPWLAYETPVLGPPWSIPFEFPIYQLLVAGLARLSGVAIDPAGRLLSYGFLLLTIIPLRSLARTWHLADEIGWIAAVLLLASPLYLYWGTTHLIETLAVLLGFAFLAEAVRALVDEGWSRTALANVYGTLAALCKITTFAPFYGLAGFALLVSLNAIRKSGRRLSLSLVKSGAIVTLTPLPFVIWDRFADRQKLQNPIGRLLASNTPMIHAWNFGTWSQLFSRTMLYTLRRSIVDTLGVAAPSILIVLLVVILLLRPISKTEAILVLACAAAFLGPFAVFTNLHIVHNYYDAANAIFLLCAVAIILGKLLSSQFRRLAWVGVVAILASQGVWFCMHFLPDLLHPSGTQVIAIANRLKSETQPDSMIVIYGWEWSSVIPYYAERRALMEPTFVPRQERIARLNQMIAAGPASGVGAFLRCGSPFDSDPDFARAFALIDQRYRKEQVGDCRLYFVDDPRGS